MEKLSLGKTPIEISEIGVGAWSWGDRFYWNYGTGYQEEDIDRLFSRAVEAGITFFDTAETYGRGRSEEILGKLLQSRRQGLVIATKFTPYPWRLAAGDLGRALDRSLQRLGLEQIDLYQVHFPYSPRSIKTWVSALGDAGNSGKVRTVGVSNYSRDQMLWARDLLDHYGLPLASNQVEYSLLNRDVETSGLLDACLENEITLIAYGPLAQGLLTGKYSSENPPPGIRRYRYPGEVLKRAGRLVARLAEIGQAHEGKTPAQVAVNWLLCRQTVPIPGAKNLRQLEEHLGSAGWRLDPTEIELLEELSADKK